MRKYSSIVLSVIVFLGISIGTQDLSADSKKPINDFLVQYLSWFAHPGGTAIDSESFGPDAFSIWSDGRVLRGQEEHVRAMRKGVQEIQSAFSSFKITPLDVKSKSYGDIGWIACLLHEEGVLKANGGQWTKDIRTTLIITKHLGRWQLLHEHSSAVKP